MKENNRNMKFLIFSIILFLIISIITSVAYIFAARQDNRTYVQQQLTVASEAIKLQLEREISRELSLISKLALSPIVRDYFMNPEDPVLRAYALGELELFQQHSTEELVFWISDIDKIFYTTGTEPFLLDPDIPENYWYNLTLYETEDYNFNINYNNDLQMINLWINIPVFSLQDDDSRIPLGMLGSGLNLSKIIELVETTHRERSRFITAFLFNQFNEITIASDFDLILNKVLLNDHLGSAGDEAIRVAASIAEGRGINYVYGDYMYRTGIVTAIKDWNIVLRYPLPGLLALNQFMNAVFFGMLFLVFVLFVVINIFSAQSNRTMSEQNVQLIDTNKRLNMVVQATKIGLWEMEIVHEDITNPTNAFYWSDEFRHMLGFKDENDFPNLLGSWINCLHPEDREKTTDHALKHIYDKTDSTPYDAEYRLLKKNGEYGYFRAYGGTLRDKQGEALRIVGSLMDVSEVKKNLMELEKQRAEADSANKAKSNFLATMSHEIRTPMNAIIGLAQIQLQKKNLPEDYTEALEKIHDSGNNLLGIINDILDLSKVETGKMELNPVEYEIPSLINDTVQLNMVRIGSKPIEFILELDENLPNKLTGDELRIKQVLNNLLSNAIKYTEKGYVKLSVSHSKLDSDNIMLCFSVEDTGQGMKQEDAEKLFSVYSRFNIDTNRATEGTGIGLYITKNLVEAMEGSIRAESEYGTGSKFTVTIKQKKTGSEIIGRELAEQLHSFTFSGKKQSFTRVDHKLMPYGKVLVVDDVETNLLVAEGLLSPYSLQVETAISGFEAIEKIKNSKTYDIIFMDHMMPVMDGIETTQKLRSLGYNGTIVALTANALAGNEEMFRQNGFDGFISKPVDMETLDEILNKFIHDRYSDANSPEDEKPKQAPVVPLKPNMIKAFLRDATKAVTSLREIPVSGNIDAADTKKYNTTVHAIKSALAYIGENELSQAALDLEMAVTKGDMSFLAANTESFIESLESLIKFMKSPNIGK